MICRSELKRLQSHNDYPSVSLLAPTYRSSPANKRDRIVVKNLLTKAIDRLHGEFKKREVASLVQHLSKLVDRVDWKHTLDGLALFASKEDATAIYLPFKVKPRVSVDGSFATRDLVYTLNRAPRYRVLVLTEKPTRLFEATTNVLTEVTDKPFPMVHSGPGGASRLPGGQGINRSGVRDESHRQFFRQVDDALASLQKEDHLPVVVVGVDRYLAFYQEITKDPDAIVGLVAGSHDNPSPSKLGKLVWPVFKAGMTLVRTRALVRLAQAVSGEPAHLEGIDQVWLGNRLDKHARLFWSRPASSIPPTSPRTAIACCLTPAKVRQHSTTPSTRSSKKFSPTAVKSTSTTPASSTFIKELRPSSAINPPRSRSPDPYRRRLAATYRSPALLQATRQSAAAGAASRIGPPRGTRTP